MLRTNEKKLFEWLKKPSSGQATVNVVVKKYFLDPNGVVLDKANPAIPAILKTKLPVFLLGNFDRLGGYAIGKKSLPNLNAALILLDTYVQGYNQPFLWDSGANTLANVLFTGDLVCIFTDSLNAPSGYVAVVQSNNYGSMASIISNTQTIQNDGKIGELSCTGIAFQVSDDKQLLQPWALMKYDNLANFEMHPYNPNEVKDPKTYTLQTFLDLPIQFLMTQFFGINFLMNFETDLMQVNFKLKLS